MAITVHDYLRIVRAHWIVLVAAVLVGGVLGGAATLLQPRVYSANSTGIVGLVSANTIGDTVASDALAKSKATTYVSVGESRVVAQWVITDLGLTDSADELATRVTVSSVRDTPTIDITAKASTGLGAKALADAWITGLAAQIAVIEARSTTQGVTSPALSPTTFLIPVESAAVPRRPVSPNLPLQVLLGALAGLAVGGGYVAVRSLFDRRIRSAAAVSGQFGLSVIGTLPRDRRLSNEVRLIPSALPGAPASFGPADRALGEAFRELRTNLRFMRVDDPPRIIVVTSPSPNDGKSTVTANLAVTLAATGQKVIVVDGDLRKPMVATSFGVVGGVGVTDLLIGSAEIQDVLQPWGDSDNLFVLGAGTIPPNPSELLGTQGMDALLHQLSRDAIVLVDAPPLLPVTDAAILSAAADGAIVVVSAGKTTTDELERALANVAMANGSVLGIILNRVPTKGADGRSYGYYYRQYSNLPNGPVAEPGEPVAVSTARRAASSRSTTG